MFGWISHDEVKCKGANESLHPEVMGVKSLVFSHELGLYMMHFCWTGLKLVGEMVVSSHKSTKFPSSLLNRCR